MAKTKNRKGFSLTEVMMALVLISTLSGIVLINASKTLKDAKINKYAQELKVMEYAVGRFRAANNAYPTSTTAGLSSNVMTQMGNFLENTDIATRWGASCDNSHGVTVFAHHVPADLLPRIQTMFADCLNFNVDTIAGAGNDVVPNYTNTGGNWGSTIFCRIKSASDLTVVDVNGKLLWSYGCQN